MLKLQTIGMLALACTPAISGAQGVDYRSFVGAPAAIALAPASPSPVGADGSPEGQNAERAPLALDFQAWGSEPQPIAPATNSARHTKAGRPLPRARMPASGAFIPSSSLRTFAPPPPSLADQQDFQGWHAIPANCPHEEYRPKGLKRDIEERRARYYTLVVTIACRAGVPANLFDALITQESGYNPYARSIKGAIGMSQLMPATARSAGIANPWDIAENLRGGAQILKAHLAEFGRYDLALAAYNAGAGRVRQTGHVPRIRETLAYVSSILSDVRRQYARAIGLSNDPAVSPAPLRTASLVRF